MSISNGTHASVNHLVSEEGGDVEHLRAENEELRSLVLELEQALRHHPAGEDGDARTREYEALLEEKSELIRNLHRKVQALEHELAKHKAVPHEAPKSSAPLPREEELMRLSEELEHERRQLKEDEESLMEQMREMEVQMARERAELARQRNELQRLQTDLHHELELAARDGTLRERLAPLQRRHQDIATRKGAAPGARTQQAAPQPEPEPEPEKKSGGLFRRLFG
jgi:hypothetical protein